MPVPPPPPPPPPSAPQVPIPKSNKSLLQSIEKGTKLKKVPESAKNDRSSGLAAAGVSLPENNRTAKPFSQNNGINVPTKPMMNNSSNDLQNQLRNQLSRITSDSNVVKDRKVSVPTVKYASVRPALNQSINKAPPPVGHPSSITNKPQFSGYNKPSPSNSLTETSNTPPPIAPQNLLTQLNNRAPPPMAPASKPNQIQSSFANKPAPTPPPVSVVRPQSSNQFSQNNIRPYSSNLFQSNSTHQLPTNNNHINNNSKAPAPNQFQSTNNTRAPPPPPAKNKPMQRNSVSMESIRSVSITPTSCDPIQKVLKPAPQIPSMDNNSRLSSVTSNVSRTTANPPPPIPGPFKPLITQNSFSLPPAPPVPSRVGVQSFSATASGPVPSKVLDRAPPPPPPPQYRASNTFAFSAFDSRFRFPDESQFPML